MTKIKILFICKHNRFRSKIGEAIFSKIVKESGREKEFEIKSAGVRLDILNPYVSENVYTALKEKGYELRDNKSREVDKLLIDWADKVILVADNVSPDSFPKSKLIVLPIRDCDQSELKCIRERVSKVEKELKQLIRSLN